MTTPNTTDAEIEKLISKALREPLPQGRISTADIAVGMLSSTDISYIIHQRILPELQALLLRERENAAIMGARFGNAAFRQYNIANPSKPINLDTTLQMGIDQAKEWAEKL